MLHIATEYYEDRLSATMDIAKDRISNNTRQGANEVVKIGSSVAQITGDGYIRVNEVYVNITTPFFNGIKECPETVEKFLDHIIKLDDSPMYIFMLIVSFISVFTSVYICCGNRKQIGLRKTQKDIVKRGEIELNIHSEKEKKLEGQSKTLTDNSADDVERQSLLNTEEDRLLLTESQKTNARIRSFLIQAPSYLQERYDYNKDMQ